MEAGDKVNGGYQPVPSSTETRQDGGYQPVPTSNETRQDGDVEPSVDSKVNDESGGATTSAPPVTDNNAPPDQAPPLDDLTRGEEQQETEPPAGPRIPEPPADPRLPNVEGVASRMRSSTVDDATAGVVSEEHSLFGPEDAAVESEPTVEEAKDDKKKKKKSQKLVTINLNERTPYARKNAVYTTDYTWWNFIPKNLFLQFRRVANRYFLLIAVLATIPDISPIDPFSSWIPLSFVLIVSAIKDAYEDIERRIADNKQNNKKTKLLDKGAVKMTKFKNIRQGNILLLEKDQAVPADMVILATSDEYGECYVETSNMDGESNYKLFSALSVTQNFQSPEDVYRLRGRVECEQSHPDFYKFYGRLVLQDSCLGVDGRRKSIRTGIADMLDSAAQSEASEGAVEMLSEGVVRDGAGGNGGADKGELVNGDGTNGADAGSAEGGGDGMPVSDVAGDEQAADAVLEEKEEKEEKAVGENDEVGNEEATAGDHDADLSHNGERRDTVASLPHDRRGSAMKKKDIKIEMDVVARGASKHVSYDAPTPMPTKTPMVQKSIMHHQEEAKVLTRTSSKTGMEGSTESTYALSEKNVLLRGASLKATKWVIGVVIYAGKQTKIMKNQRKAKAKFSNVEKKLNNIIKFVFCCQILFCLIGGLMAYEFQERYTQDNEYFNDVRGMSAAAVIGLNFMTYLLLLNIMIPISLYTTFEVIRLIQKWWMQLDLKMCADPYNFSKTRFQVKTSNLVDELGQVGYIFSDKTGTLTENKMEFVKLWVNGEVFNELENPGVIGKYINEDGAQAARALEALRVLSVCHTALPEVDEVTGDISYQAQSPDEIALLKAAKSNGVIYSTNKRKNKRGEVMIGRELKVLVSPGGRWGGLTHGEVNSPRIMSFANEKVEAAANMGATKADKDGEREDGAPDGGGQSDQTGGEGDTAGTPKGPEIEVEPTSAAANIHSSNMSLPEDVESDFPGLLSLSNVSVHPNSIYNGSEIGGRYSDEFFKVLAILEFDSYRKRQSVVCKTPSGEIMLYSKGADSSMLEILRDDTSASELDDLGAHINHFAREGLRVLVLGRRILSRQYFTEWSRRYDAAFEMLEGREEALTELALEIEKDLELVGATAVEDKLQEEVPETIRYLIKAGIVVWLQTGDKQETAINIGYSSGLIEQDSLLLIVNAEDTVTLREKLEQCGQDLAAAAAPAKVKKGALGKVCGSKKGQSINESGNCIVIDGKTMQLVLDDGRLRKMFYRLATQCKSVIICRASPKQKALVVRMVKKFTSKITLAIGDGANDVVMIKEAHVGVGIAGQEGTQAVRSSDFAIHKFKFLRRMLAVHGRYQYVRNSTYIQYFLYKNMAFVFGHLWFSFFSGFSGQIVHDSWVQASYNVVFTSLAPFIIAWFERDVEEHLLDRYPHLYRRLTKGGTLMNVYTMAAWLCNALVHSGVLFFGTYGIMYNDVVFSNGWTGDLWFMSTILSCSTLIVVNIKIALIMKSWVTWINHVAVWGSIILYFLFVIAYNSMGPLSMTSLWLNFHEYQFVFFTTCRSANFWLGVPLIVALAILPDYLYLYCTRLCFPKDWQVVQELDRKENPMLCGFPVPKTLRRNKRKSRKVAAYDDTVDEEAGGPMKMDDGDGLARSMSEGVEDVRQNEVTTAAAEPLAGTLENKDVGTKDQAPEAQPDGKARDDGGEEDRKTGDDHENNGKVDSDIAGKLETNGHIGENGAANTTQKGDPMEVV